MKDKQNIVPKNIWLDPTEEMLGDSEFEAIWQAIKSWDVNVPDIYEGYCGANGYHVRVILDALRKYRRESIFSKENK